MKPNVQWEPQKHPHTWTAKPLTTIQYLHEIAAMIDIAIKRFKNPRRYMKEECKHDKKVHVWQKQRPDGLHHHTATQGQLKRHTYEELSGAELCSTTLHAHPKRNGYI